jgi:hypothetical protein|nr:hypothetical protein [Neorhizobium tomejilense]
MTSYRFELLRRELVSSLSLPDMDLARSVAFADEHPSREADKVFRAAGDTASDTDLAEYVKHLDRCRFEQIADFPMFGDGRALVFGRQERLALAVLTAEADVRPTLTVSARCLLDTYRHDTLPFCNEWGRVQSSAAVTAKAVFDGQPGLHAKLHCLDTLTTTMNSWWALDDDGKPHYARDVATELLSLRDRQKCPDFDRILEMTEARRNGLPSEWFELFDAGRSRTLSDAFSPPSLAACGQRR